MADLRRTKPYGTRILVDPMVLRTLKDGMLDLSDNATDWLLPQQGEVIDVGDQVEGIEAGDTVLYGPHAGTEFAGALFIKQADVICRL